MLQLQFPVQRSIGVCRAQGHPPASSCLAGFGMSVRRELCLLGCRTTCTECRYSPCSTILHKQHDAPRRGNTQWKIKASLAKTPELRLGSPATAVPVPGPPRPLLLVLRQHCASVAHRCARADLNRQFPRHAAQMEGRLLGIC